MPKQLITVIGLVVSLGVIAVAVALVALPMWVQSLGVDAQTATVAQTNAMYQAQVTMLEAEQERQDEIDASVAALRAEIPATDQFDDVFEVIGRAAAQSGVTISSVTAGEAAPFVERTAATAVGEAPVAEPAAAESGDPAAADTGSADGDDGASADAAAVDLNPVLSGRQQVDFTILVTADDMAEATAFLDALRNGPRLLSSITATTTQTGTAVEVQVTALTFVDSEG